MPQPQRKHNDGELSTLEEITLHQFDIEKIENLHHCRKLKILHLQHNQITKIEGLNRLKELEYLNLALNNISKIENLQGCETLRKLDLTVNFVADFASIDHLSQLDSLRELYRTLFVYYHSNTKLPPLTSWVSEFRYLTGNPVAQTDGYREYVIATLPQLQVLDGEQILKSNKLTAHQQISTISQQIANGPAPQEFPLPDAITLDAIEQQDNESLAYEFQHGKSDHTPASRLIAARQLAKLREGNSATTSSTTTQTKPPKKLNRITPDGRIMQCNEGKYQYEMIHTDNLLVLDVSVSKYIDTSLIDVDVQEEYIRVEVKNKLLQLTLDESVTPRLAVSQRSQASGKLLVYMVLSKSKYANMVSIQDALDVKAFEEQEEQVRKRQLAVTTKSDQSITTVKESSETVDYRNIVPVSDENELNKSTGRRRYVGGGNMMRQKFQRESTLSSSKRLDDFEDDPDVPPLV